MKDYYYVRYFGGIGGRLTIAPSKKHLSRPKTKWERYPSKEEALQRLAEWGFTETTDGKRYFSPSEGG